jgi:hypothetical protein
MKLITTLAIAAAGSLAFGIWLGSDGTHSNEYFYHKYNIDAPAQTNAKTNECLPGWTLSKNGGFCTNGNQVKMPDSVRKAVEQEIIRSLSFDQKKIDATFAYMRKHNLSPNEVCKSKLRRNHEDYCQRGDL